MSKLDISSYNDSALSLENSEGQRELLSNNLALSRCPSLSSSIFSEETMEKLKELGAVLKTIHIRMKKEGYDMIDGKIEKLQDTGNSIPTDKQ